MGESDGCLRRGLDNHILPLPQRTLRVVVDARVTAHQQQVAVVGQRGELRGVGTVLPPARHVQ